MSYGFSSGELRWRIESPSGANGQWLVVIEKPGPLRAWHRFTKGSAERKLRRELRALGFDHPEATR